MIRLALLLGLLFAGTARAQETRQFNNLIYTTPPHWTHRYSTGPFILLRNERTDGRCRECFIHIATGSPGAWDPLSYLTTQIYTFVPPDQRAAVQVLQMPEAASAAGRTVGMMALSVSGKLIVLIALTAGEHTELIAFEGPGHDQTASAETMAVFGETIEGFITSFRYISEGAAPLVPSPEPGPFAGLWWGWKTIWVPTLDYQMRMEIQHRLFVFWPDGTFYEGTPPGGLAMPDRAALIAAGDLNVGTYAVSGGTITLTWANGLSATLPVSEQTIADGDRAMNPVEVFPDGTTIDGKLASFFFGAFNPFAGMSGGATSMSEVLFFPDGHWESSAFASASGSFKDVGTGETTGSFGSSSGIDSQHGTYVVKDGVVIRTPADGSAPSSAFIFKDADGNILIGDQMLEPRD